MRETVMGVLAPGTLISDRFEIEEPVGHGGMGTVYRALALVLAPPGAGKSRLRHELLRRARDKHPEAQIFAGFGDLLTAGSPYTLVSDALRRHAQIRADEPLSRAQALVTERLCARVDATNAARVSAFWVSSAASPSPSSRARS